MRAEIAYYRAHHDEAGDAAAAGRGCATAARRCCATRCRGAAGGSTRTTELRAALLAALRFRPYPEVPGGARRAAGGRARARRRLQLGRLPARGARARPGCARSSTAPSARPRPARPSPTPRIFARALRARRRAPRARRRTSATRSSTTSRVRRGAGLRAVLVARAGAPADVPPGGRRGAPRWPSCTGSRAVPATVTSVAASQRSAIPDRRRSAPSCPRARPRAAAIARRGWRGSRRWKPWLGLVALVAGWSS